MKKVLFGIMACTLLIASCSKDDNGNNNGGGNNNGNDTIDTSPLVEAWRVGNTRYSNISAYNGNMGGTISYNFANAGGGTEPTAELQLYFRAVSSPVQISAGEYSITERDAPLAGEVRVEAWEEKAGSEYFTKATESGNGALRVVVAVEGGVTKITVPKLAALRGTSGNQTNASTIEAKVEIEAH